MNAKKIFITAALALTIMFNSFAANKVTIKNYPDFKFGFTTINFAKALPVSKDNIMKLVDFAKNEGFAFIELRDPTATLTYDECKAIASYAKQNDIEVVYALNIGFLDPKFDEIFTKGLDNASCFTNGPKTMRIIGAGPEYSSDPQKNAYTAEEIQKILPIAEDAAKKAKAKGVNLVIENTYEVFGGNGKDTFGFKDLYDKISSNFSWQPDTANFFAVSRVVTNPSDAEDYLNKNAKKIIYIHLKTSNKDHKVPAVLEENELPFKTVFDILSKNNVKYIAIELPQQATFEECAQNHKKSAEFLIANY